MNQHVNVISTSPPMAVRLLSVAMAPALAVIMGVDLRIRGSEEILVHGIADELAHLLTALVVLSALRAMGMRLSWPAVVIGATIPDIEHVLALAGQLDAIGTTGRGVLHTLVPGAIVAGLGMLLPPLRVFLLSLGLAMLSHVVRDAATSEIPALWPHAVAAYHLRYVFFLAMLAGCATITTGAVALAAREAPASLRHAGTRGATHVSATQPLEFRGASGGRRSG